MRIDDYSRRDFLRQGLQTAGGLVLTPTLLAQTATSQPATTPASSPKKFEISLAAWSVHRMFFADKIKQIDMPELCRKEFDIGGLELVNSFFASPQYTYCKDLRKRAEDSGVKILLIMCDGEGDMCHSQMARRGPSARLPLDPLQRQRRRARRPRRGQALCRELCGVGGVGAPRQA